MISLYCSVMVDRLYRAISRNSLIRSSSRSDLARAMERYFSRSSSECQRGDIIRYWR